jgi:hypothetical protein
MFCLIYSTIQDGDYQPNVLELSQSQSSLSKLLEDKAIQQCIDEVGRKNFVNTLETTEDMLKINYPVYPSLALKRINENKMEVYKIVKKQVVDKGYIYNSYKDEVLSSLVGTYLVVKVENWKYEDLPQRPTFEEKKTTKPFEKKSENMIQNYDKVLLQLIENIQKRKVL